MPKVFISYSHKDEEWKDRLLTHLNVLAKQNRLEVWDDRRIAAGDEWLPEIEQAINSCHVALLLVSANFLISNFILSEEVPRLFERRKKDGVRLIPVIVKPCAWQNIDWLKRMQAQPKDGRPLSSGNDHQIDADLSALANEIADLLKRARHAPSAMPFAPLPPEKIYTAKLPTTRSELFGREKELHLLDEAWADEHTHLVSFVAWGGVGKTAAVNEWLSRLERDNFRGAERVFGWSFYSQGTKEDRNVSADQFFDEALRWFGYTGAPLLSPWNKGVRLAELLRQQKTLLILDGLEPLQYPPGPLQGELKDQGLKALLKELGRANFGLCVVTTRVALKDLSHTEGKTTRHVALENLSAEAGAQLLQHLQVKGADKELREAVQEFGGHALALSLLGRYLVVLHDGEIRKRDLIPYLTEEEEQGGHARRVMESYERWLAGKPELDILYLMGLFDRPATKDAIDALLAPPPIEGLTSHLSLANLQPASLQYAIQHLRDLRLLAAKDENRPDTLDCHPLVREHFGEKLRAENPKAWQEAHRRLYEYYKNLPKKHLPDTLEEMEPLFAAVAHGCQAARYQEVLDEVYYPRMQRGEATNYCGKYLGVFSIDLAALSNFFDIPWHKTVSDLSEFRKACVLGGVGYRLRAMGRLREAIYPMQAASEMFIKQKNWIGAANTNSNLNEFYLTLGEVKQAVRYARYKLGLC